MPATERTTYIGLGDETARERRVIDRDMEVVEDGPIYDLIQSGVKLLAKDVFIRSRSLPRPATSFTFTFDIDGDWLTNGALAAMHPGSRIISDGVYVAAIWGGERWSLAPLLPNVRVPTEEELAAIGDCFGGHLPMGRRRGLCYD